MRTRRTWVAVLAVLGLVVATVMGVLYSQQRSTALVDTGETRASVQTSLERLLPSSVEWAHAAGLTSAVEKLQKERYVASVWVVDGSGEIVLAWHGPGRSGENVKALASGDMARALDALPPDTLSEAQGLELLTVGAMRREGEHNDVFRHLLCPLHNEAGDLTALVAVTYDVSSGVGDPSRSMGILLLIGLAGFAVYWLGLPLWAYLDARARGDVPALWGAFVFVTNLVGLLAYLIVNSRPQK